MSQDRQFISLSQAQPPFFAGLDLGGTDVKVGVVDDLGRPLSWLTIPTEPQKGPEDAAQRMGNVVLQAIEKAGLEPSAIGRVGLGSPGLFDSSTGTLVDAGELQAAGTAFRSAIASPRIVGCRSPLPTTPTPPPTASSGSAPAASSTAWSCSPWARASVAASSSATWPSTARTATAPSAATSSSTVPTMPGCAAADSAAISKPTPAPRPW